MNNIIEGNSFAKLYKKALDLVWYSPDFECSPRGQKIKECLNVTLVLNDPLNNLFYNEIRAYPKKYLANELLLYLSETNSAEEFGKHAKLWLDVQNDDGTVNSAYGHLIFKKKECVWEDEPCSQWDWALNSLLKDPDSRQAIIHYNTPVHQYSGVKDFVCTLHNQFFIRNNKLFMNYYFRSNDIFFGTTVDFVWATILMQMAHNRLLDVYPDLKLGKLSYTAASLHLYERHFEKAELMVKFPFWEARIPKITADNSEFYKWIEKWK